MDEKKTEIMKKAVNYIIDYLEQKIRETEDSKVKSYMTGCYYLLKNYNRGFIFQNGDETEGWESLECIRIRFHDDGYDIDKESMSEYGMGYSKTAEYDFSELLSGVKEILLEYNNYLVESGEIYSYNFFNGG